MIAIIQAWLSHGYHPGHLFELAFLLGPTMALAAVYMRAWWTNRA
jgi:hypothetical protein